MTPIQAIYTFLNEAGLFNPWKDDDGELQDAVTVQMRYLEEQECPTQNMLLLIKQTGGAGDLYVTEPMFTLAIMSKVGQGPAYPEQYAKLLFDAMLYFNDAVSNGITNAYDSARFGDIYNSLLDFAMMMNIEGPADYAEKMLQRLYNAITQTELSETCVISSQPVSAINGAYKTESGRYAYDMDFMLRVDNGRVL